MARSIAEVQADLDTVNAALQQLIAGERITRLNLGSGEFAKNYEFQDITYDSLKEEKAHLQSEMDSLTPDQEMIFRNHGNVPLIVTKFNRYT